ncbi:hypothetical protein VTO42DRAFT_6508 [Malbranchea cinnamomea]
MPANMPDNYELPYPAYCARFPRSSKHLVTAIVGAQYASEAEHDGLATAHLSAFMKAGVTSQPSFWELASETDSNGAYNIAIIAYWPSKASYTDWTVTSGFQKWWEDLDPNREPIGWFLEVFFPSIDRFETCLSDKEVLEGAAHMGETMSGPIAEHSYWGSVRDRLPICQTDAVIGEKSHIQTRQQRCAVSTGRRIRISGKRNLAVIRSGQDWSRMYPDERKLYLETIHPVLVNGMNFLRDHGDEVGCYSCRFMQIIDPVSHKVDKKRTFGLAYFDDLGSLERWSKQHPTHLNIFDAFLKYTKHLNNNISLRLFHEVLVLEPEQQLFEYVGCHEDSGMLVSKRRNKFSHFKCCFIPQIFRWICR